MTQKSAIEEVVLVDEDDQAIGTMEKHEAHRQGRLHRAFSIFLFDAEGRILLQQRASNKYHSAALWTNTCCGHPRPGERLATAAKRRLHEEMGLMADLDHRFAFTYKAAVGNGLTEHEFDHVFLGRATTTPTPDPGEAQDWRPAGINELSAEMEDHPERFTAWLHICWPLVREQLLKKRA